jgi:phosphohistidine swiveling domain-containing protein
MIKDINIPKSTLQKLVLTHEVAIWNDHRKEMSMRGNHYLNEFLKEISGRMNVPLEDLYWVTPSETNDFFLKHKKIPKNLAKERMEHLVQVFEYPGKETLFTGEDAAEIITAFDKKESSQGSELKGVVASTGKKKVVKGKVRVVMDVSNTDFLEGEILVASMTRPDYVPLMKKAIAIITKEGGITSHASIAARELRIPCIIGVKNVTKLLKNGDTVEMDLEKGTVRKIR